MEPFRPANHLILVVDDEPDMRDVVVFNLRQEGYQVRSAETGEEALALAKREPPSLVVLDLMLPDIPGAEVCRALRADPTTRRIPIIMLTARGAEVDRVAGFESGADDYVVKPFSVRELSLRIRARLRDTPASAEPSLRLGRIEIQRDAHRVLVDHVDVHLSLLEFRLLEDLVQNAGKVRSRETLLDEVWGYSTEAETRTVDTHIKRLRDKLGEAGSAIETIRGVGYRFNP